ncbi:hypothetical protein MRX96_042578 [Rhipicephalus microplus]
MAVAPCTVPSHFGVGKRRRHVQRRSSTQPGRKEGCPPKERRTWGHFLSPLIESAVRADKPIPASAEFKLLALSLKHHRGKLSRESE